MKAPTADMDTILDKRDKQIKQVIKVLAHLPVDQQIAIVCMWMSVEEVDRMLKRITKKELTP